MRPPPPTDPYVTNSVIRFVSIGPCEPITLQGTSPQGDMTVAARLSANPCAKSPSQSTPVLLRQVVGSRSPCLSWAQMSCPALPSRCLAAFIVGPLGLGSPRLRAWRTAAPCSAVLCVATTAFVRPGRFALRSLPVPWVDALWFVSLPACAGVGSSAGRVGHQTPGCWLRRSPLLRRLLPRRREALPSSRVTPLNPCPALRPRWYPARLP